MITGGSSPSSEFWASPASPLDLRPPAAEASAPAPMTHWECLSRGKREDLNEISKGVLGNHQHLGIKYTTKMEISWDIMEYNGDSANNANKPSEMAIYIYYIYMVYIYIYNIMGVKPTLRHSSQSHPHVWDRCTRRRVFRERVDHCRKLTKCRHLQH